MKMNKKGFTLIELLAIIVILAIIAVITVPIILNIIDNARKGAAKDSVIGYGKAVELAYTQYQYDQKLGTVQTGTTPVKIDSATATNLKVDYDGTPVDCAQIVIKDGKLQMAQCKINNANSPLYSYNSGKAYVDSDGAAAGYVADLTSVIGTLPTAPAAQNSEEPAGE